MSSTQSSSSSSSHPSFNPIRLPAHPPLLKPSTMPHLDNDENKGTSWLSFTENVDTNDLEAIYQASSIIPASFNQIIINFERFLKESLEFSKEENFTPTVVPELQLFIDLKERAENLPTAPKVEESEEIDIDWDSSTSNIDLPKQDENFKEEFTSQLHNQLQRLRVGGEILLPGGVAQTNILYLIHKTSINNCSITIYNTDEGKQFHHSEVIHSELYHQNFVIYTGIPFAALCNDVTLQTLIELKSKDDVPVHTFYRIIESLGGKREAPLEYKTNPEAFSKTQKINSNNTKPLFAFLKHHLVKKDASEGLNEYKRIKFFYQGQLILKLAEIYCHEDSKHLSTFNKQANFLVTKWARFARKLAKENLLTESVLKDCEATVIDILEKLQDKKQFQKSPPTQSKPLQFPPAVDSFKTEIDSIICQSLSHVVIHPHTSAYSFIPKIDIPPSDEPAAWEETSLVSVLKRTIDAINENNYDPKFRLRHKNPFVELAKSLPLPSKKVGTLWDQIPQNQVGAALDLIAKLSLSIRSSNPNVEILLAKYSLMAIADKLGRRLPETHLDSYKLPYYGLFYLAHSSDVELITAADNERIFALTNYFDENIDIDSRPPFMEPESIFCLQEKISGYYGRIGYSIERHAFLSYYDNLLEQKEIKDILPHTDSKYREDKLEMLLNGTVKLPKSIDALRKICFHTCYHGDEDEIFTDYTYKFDKIANILGEEFFLINVYAILDSKTENTDAATDLVEVENSNAITTIAPAAEKVITLKELKKLNVSTEKLIRINYLGDTRLNTQKNYRQNDAIYHEPTERQRENRVLSINYEDEVVRALSYYHEQEGLLEDPQEQKIFRAHLLRPGRLSSQVMGEPRTATKLMAFLNTKIDFFLSVQKRDHALFFIELAHICKTQIHEIREKNQERFAHVNDDLNLQMRDYFAMAHEILPTQPLKIKNDIFNTLSRMHFANIEKCKENLTDNIATDILLQCLLDPLFPLLTPKNIFASYETPEEQMKIYQEYSRSPSQRPADIIYREQARKDLLNIVLFPLISKKIESDPFFKNTVLNNVMSVIGELDVNEEWNCTDSESQQFESADGKYKIVLSGLRVYIDDQPLTLFPGWVLKDETFTKIVPSFRDENTKLSENSKGEPFFNILCDNGKTYEVYIIKIVIGNYRCYENKIMIKTTLDDSGIKYRYVEPSHISPSLSKALPPTLTKPNVKIWVEDTLNTNTTNVCCETEEGKRYWIELAVTLDWSRHPICTLKSISEEKVNPTKRLLNLVEMSDLKNSESINPLFSFAANNDLLIWTDARTNTLSEMEIPGFGKYKIRDGKAYSQDITGFHLAEEQECAFIGKPRSYLLLINDKGDRKVIMPREQIDGACLTFDLEDVNGVTRLVPNSISDTLYLVHMMMEKGQYRQALYYLKHSSDTVKYTALDNQIIEAIMRLPPAPSCVVLQLKLLVMVNENSIKYGAVEVSEEEVQRLGVLYFLYLTNINHTTLTKLSLNEEKSILRRIQSYLDNEIEKLEKQTEEAITNTDAMDMASVIGAIQANIMRLLTTLGHPVLTQRLIALTGTKNANSPFAISSVPIPKVVAGTFTISNREKFLHSLVEAENKLPVFANIIDMTDISTHLPNFYMVAKEGTAEDKKRLQLTLNMIENILKEGEKETLAQINFIRAVIKSPNWFPTKDAITKALDKTSFNDLATGDDRDNYSNHLLSVCRWIESHGIPPLLADIIQGICGSINTAQVGINTLQGIFNLYKQTAPKAAVNELNFGLPNLIESTSDETTVASLENYDSLNTLDASLDKLFNGFKNAFEEGQPVKDLIESIEYSLSQMNAELLKDETGIVTVLNRIDATLTTERRMKRWGKEMPALTLEDAEELFERGTMEGYKKYTSLSDEEIRDIDLFIAKYLVKATRVEQAARLLSELKKISNTSDEEEKAVLKERYIAESKAQRCHLTTYKNGIALSRTYLVFEKHNKILLRPNQVESLNECALYVNNPMELLKQLSTGSGKSKAISPVIQRLRAHLYGKDKKMVINLWPLSLYTENKKDMRHIIKKSFGQDANSFDFARDYDVSKGSLAHINRNIANSIMDGEQMNATPESVQAMELKFLESLYNAAFEDDAPEEGQIAFFQEILRHYAAAEAHIDECHLNCSPKREVNFTIGQPKTEPVENVALISYLYRLMIDETKPLNALLGIKNNQQYNLTYDTYKNTVMPTLAREMATYLGIRDEDFPTYFSYVTGTMTDEIPDTLKNHRRFNEIALLRGELTFLLCNIKNEEMRTGTLFGSTGVHYGLSKKKPDEPGYVEYAKPYEANDVPNEPAQFDNIHEALNKTFQTYLHKRLSTKHLWDLILIFRSQAIEEATANSNKGTHETKGYRDYQRLFKKTENNLPDLFFIEKETLIAHQDAINTNDELVLFYVENIVVPKMTKFARKLRSNPQNLHSIFKNTIKMTATPGKKEIYGIDVDFKEEMTVDANGDAIPAEKKIEDTLLEKCPNEKKCVFSTSHVKAADILLDLMDTRLPNDTDARMLIDIGALFKGMSNRAVANALLAHFKTTKSPIKGVVFFAENNKMMVLLDNGDIVPINQCSLDPKHRFSYCDQIHAFGADIKQYPQAKGICTWDQFVDKAEILQGIGRLREFVTGAQSAEWFVPEIALEAINTTSDDVTFSRLYEYSTKVLKERQSELLLLSLRQQMRNEVRAACMKKLRDTTDPDEVVNLFRSMKAALVDEMDDSPISLYGQIVKTASGAELLQVVRRRTLVLLESIETLDSDTKDAIRDKLGDNGAYDRKIQELNPLLPEKVELHNTEMGLQCEAQQEVQMQVEMNEQVVTGSKRKLRSDTPWGTKFDPYTADWIAPSSTVDRINMVARGIVKAIQKVFFIGFYPTIKLFDILDNTRSNITGIVLGAASPFVITINFVAFAIFSLPVYVALGIALSCVLAAKLIRYMVSTSSVIDPKVPLYRASDVIKSAKDEELAAMHEVVADTDENALMMTNNFIILRPYSFIERPVVPLGNEQKAGFEVLVVIDTAADGQKKYTVLMGDQSTDAEYWRKKLRNDYENTTAAAAASRTRQICLYDLHKGIVQDSKNQIDEKALIEDQHFVDLIVKAKLYNADVVYSEKEYQALKRMIAIEGKAKQVEDFMSKALIWHERKEKSYKTSPLAQMLADAQKKKD